MRITQSNLNSYTITLRNTNSTINDIIGANTNNLKNWFNDYWVSPTARTNADAIDDALNMYQSKVVELFNDINSKISRNVNTHNYNEYTKKEDEIKEIVFYNKVSLTRKKSTIRSNMNATLPKKYIGRLHDTANVYYPIDKTRSTIDALDRELRSAISSCDVISNKGEYRAELQSIKNDAINSIESERSRLNSIYNN